MASLASKPERFMLHSIIPILCSMIVGFFFYQGDLFERTHPAFQFVWSALVMAFFYNLLHDVSARDAKIGFIVLAFLTIMTTHSTRPTYILRDLLYIAGMWGAVVLYVRYYVRSAVAPTLTSAVTFAGLYGVTCVVATTCDVLLLKVITVGSTPVMFREVVAGAASYGLLIGFALGTGFELAEKLPRYPSPAVPDVTPEEGSLHAGR